MKKEKKVQPLLFAPVPSANTTLTKRLREQEEAMRRAMEKVRLSPTREIDAIRAMAKRWREQEEATRQALEKWRRPLTPETYVMRTLTEGLGEQAEARQRVAEKIRLALNPKTDAMRVSTVWALTVRLGEQAEARQRAMEKIRLALNPKTDAMRALTVWALTVRLGEQAEVRRRAMEKARLSPTPETDVRRTLAKKRREQEETIWQALERNRLSIFSVTDIVKLYAKELPRYEPAVQASDKWRLPGPTTANNSRSLSLIFDALAQLGKVQIVCRYGDQRIAKIVPKKSAYAAYAKGCVLCFIGIVHEDLFSFVEEVMHGKFGADWEKEIPRKVRRHCEQDQSRYASSASTPNSLLAHATFRDLSNIICSDMNWGQVFKGIFLEQDIVKGSLCWLHTIRNTAAHGLSVSKEDQERLVLEAKHIDGVLQKFRKMTRSSAISSG